VLEIETGPNQIWTPGIVSERTKPEGRDSGIERNRRSLGKNIGVS
jgi:hypothetical protein